MTHSKTGRLARILGIVAGLLAWTAVGVGYARSGELRWGLLAAGVFVAALPFIRSGGSTDTPPK